MAITQNRHHSFPEQLRSRAQNRRSHLQNNHHPNPVHPSLILRSSNPEDTKLPDNFAE